MNIDRLELRKRIDRYASEMYVPTNFTNRDVVLYYLYECQKELNQIVLDVKKGVYDEV